MPEVTAKPVPIAYSVAELAAETSLSKQLLYQEIESGRLRSKRIRGRIVIPASAVEDWLALRD
ncbi:MAG: helix-turn-helix domain-containing protein [Candidatus Nanopelagicales bacterium]